jgi:hypothetical protein
MVFSKWPAAVLAREIPVVIMLGLEIGYPSNCVTYLEGFKPMPKRL